MPWAAYAAEHPSLGPKADILHYRCEIVSIYSHLQEISFEYGNILINEDELYIFHASKAAARAFDDTRGELVSMHIPRQMDEPHRILIKSVNTYTESARNIEKALGIFIGQYEGNENDTLELIDKSEGQAVLANKYLAESLDMYEKLFVLDGDFSKSCKKYVAAISY